MVTESIMRPQQKCTSISKAAIPLIFMTLITLLWLSIALFYKKRAAEDQSTCKSISLFCGFAFWLVRTVVHWPVNIWQNKLQTVWILDILWQALCSDKVSILGGKQMPYTFQSKERRFFFFFFKCDLIFFFFFFFVVVVVVVVAYFVVSFSCFPSFALHPYHININWHIFQSTGVTSLRKLVRHSGVQVCIATTAKV